MVSISRGRPVMINDLFWISNSAGSTAPFRNSTPPSTEAYDQVGARGDFCLENPSPWSFMMRARGGIRQVEDRI